LGLEPSRRRLHGTINMQVVKALLPLAVSAKPAVRKEVLAEI
jgi:hypothetical protein